MVLIATPTAASTASPKAQSETTTTTGAADENPLLVPGPTATDGSEPASGGEPASATESGGADDVAQEDPNGGTTNDEAEDTVRMVMYALVAVAVALTALTIYYWWRTRPARRSDRARGDLASEDGGADGDVDDAPKAGALRRDEDASDEAEVPEVGESRAERRARRRSAGASATEPDDAGTVDAWQTDSTSTR